MRLASAATERVELAGRRGQTVKMIRRRGGRCQGRRGGRLPRGMRLKGRLVATGLVVLLLAPGVVADASPGRGRPDGDLAPCLDLDVAPRSVAVPVHTTLPSGPSCPYALKL